MPGTIEHDDIRSVRQREPLAVRRDPNPLEPMRFVNRVPDRKLHPVPSDHGELVAARLPIGGNDVVENFARRASRQRNTGEGPCAWRQEQPHRVVVAPQKGKFSPRGHTEQPGVRDVSGRDSGIPRRVMYKA